jgi:hypothetical protein
MIPVAAENWVKIYALINGMVLQRSKPSCLAISA